MFAGHNLSGALIASINPLFPVMCEYIPLLQSEHSNFFPFFFKLSSLCLDQKLFIQCSGYASRVAFM
jgi:hypothetical protein